MKTDLEAMVSPGETIYWRGKPDKKCFILESIFNPMLLFALVWLGFDAVFIVAALTTEGGSAMLVFLLIHLMPVWMYIGGVLGSVRKHRNTEYIITDRGIYISGGTFTKNYEMKPFTDLSHINIHRGLFDQMLGVGDVITVCSHITYNGNDSHGHAHSMNLCDLSDYQEVFSLVSRLQTDIYSDTMYPNDKRPDTNSGYQTKYTPRDRY